ncbi:hypothetical protein E3A20_05540 [Planctomyces bekefii]|uniref:Carrier domain-containing protein n=1 Tax=Planctomyces bekefii TaxID=1653850 RepID=A0A5C6M9P8_9PLAN|nr:hypothetical protein E3A20_05540 [Planctomyces bekefii]
MKSNGQRFFPSDLVVRVDRLSKTAPQSKAARDGTRDLTYDQLAKESRILASRLRESGVQPGDVVGVYLPSSCEQLVAILAIFRVSGVYMPLSPDHPIEYLQGIIDDARPKALVSTAEITRALEAAWPREVRLPHVVDASNQLEGTSNLDVSSGALTTDSKSSPDDLAYLMFTSGTTGRPKGVLLSNGNLDHFIGEANRLLAAVNHDVFANVARSTFSISLFDLLVPLTVGASINFVKRERVLDFASFVHELKGSTVLHAGPALLNSLYRYLKATSQLDQLQHMRHVSTGGDIVHPFVMEAMREIFPNAELFVFYGSTEVACMGTFFQFQSIKGHGKSQGSKQVHAAIDRVDIDRPYVGRPFPGAQVFLYDQGAQQFFESSSGQEGEICFGGRGVGIGYLNRSEETSKSFIKYPQSSAASSDLLGKRLYRTGDYGRWTQSGQLEFLGRRDFQVQVRGMRVETAGIENLIVDLKLAQQCVVVLRGESLSAFLVPAPPEPGVASTRKQPAELAKLLAKHLPSEMIPSGLYYLEKMPTNFNGKLDRKQLQSMDFEQLAGVSSADSDLTTDEAQIASVFCQELHLARVPKNESFFACGGHSLMAVLVLQRLHSECGITLSVAEFFENPTVAGLATAWQRRRASGAAPAAARPHCTPVRLTPLDAAKPTVFLLAGAHIYRNLAAQLASFWNVYGLVSDKETLPFLDNRLSFSVQELAQDYLQALTEIQKQGPYFILGHSFGGVVAFQLAQDMTQKRLDVAALLMVDAIMPEWAQPLRFRIMQFLRVFRTPPHLMWRFLKRAIKSHGLSRQLLTKWSILPKADAAQQSVPMDTPYEARLGEMDRARIHKKRDAAVAFMLGLEKSKARYPEATLFLSKTRHQEYPLHSRSLTWKRYVRHLDTIWIAAGHSEMVTDPVAIGAIADELKRVYEQRLQL